MNGTRKWGRALFATLTLLLVGCAARNDYSAVDRAHPHAINADAGSIALRHVYLDAPEGSAHSRGATMALRLSIINTGQTRDALTRVSSPLAAQVTRQDPTGVRTDQPLGLPAGQVVRMQYPTDTGWSLQAIRADVFAGTTVPVTFHFANQGRFTVLVPIASK
jgi:copper(I)-binding protein